MTRDPARSHQNQEPIEGMEARLQSRFSPVTPDPEFVNRLRRNLTSPPETELEVVHAAQAFFIALGVTIGALMAVGLLIRIVWWIFKWSGISRTDND